MTWVAVSVGGAALVGSLISANAAKGAASTQANAANRAADISQQQWEATNAQQQPYRTTGYSALNYIAGMGEGQSPYYDMQGNIMGTTPGSGYMFQKYPEYKPFTNADLNANLAPNYEFQLKQGQGATNAAYNASGGTVSGNAFKGMQDYTQNYAAGAYQNALNNYMLQQQQGYNQFTGQQTNQYNRLASMAGLGQTSLGQTTNAGVVNASNVGSQLVNAGTANASGQVGTANAITGGMSNLSNMYLANNLSGGRLFGGGSTNLNSLGSNYSSSPSMYQTYGSSGGSGGGFGIKT